MEQVPHFCKKKMIVELPTQVGWRFCLFWKVFIIFVEQNSNHLSTNFTDVKIKLKGDIKSLIWLYSLNGVNVLPNLFLPHINIFCCEFVNEPNRSINSTIHSINFPIVGPLVIEFRQGIIKTPFRFLTIYGINMSILLGLVASTFIPFFLMNLQKSSFSC